ncbi:hypothetical protein VFPFJ_08764 [Purpureocillium lilacinum]|uniref:Uncharacterized protein n=1 Tax=Purpureocillium lilacinum TaxID=33203 RepID=A0A179H0F4_PURLI|nr:hypothetical protein VFPFJ_08764 [Purpureocillium lilacinum]OAQ82961.1 hypothetical protein VFPFJ_08764 [Purpureocillium lilacinum]
MMASDLDDCFRGRVGLQAVLGFFCGHGKGKGNKQRGGICLIGCAGKAPLGSERLGDAVLVGRPLPCFVLRQGSR